MKGKEDQLGDDKKRKMIKTNNANEEEDRHEISNSTEAIEET